METSYGHSAKAGGQTSRQGEERLICIAFGGGLDLEAYLGEVERLACIEDQTPSGELRTYDISFDRFWCGASGFSFWLERHMVALEGHEEDIVTPVSGK